MNLIAKVSHLWSLFMVPLIRVLRDIHSVLGPPFYLTFRDFDVHRFLKVYFTDKINSLHFDLKLIFKVMIFRIFKSYGGRKCK